MTVHRSPGAALASAALVVALVGGCGSPTAPEPLPLVLEEVRLQTEDEFRTWPAAPVVSGEDALVIRGTALAGCGTLAADATRRGQRITVRVVTHGDREFCELSRRAWQPFSVRTSALRPGRYDVQVSTVGHPGRSRVRGLVIEP